MFEILVVTMIILSLGTSFLYDKDIYLVYVIFLIPILLVYYFSDIEIVTNLMYCIFGIVGIITFLGKLSLHEGNKPRKYASSMLPLLIFSIIVNVALWDNYSKSLIPGYYDGMGMSNKLAYGFIGDDSWSTELYNSAFEQSIYISVIFIVVYLILLIMDRSRIKRNKSK
ncbi:hypothetical protein [Chengkuizengella marina]|uniref:Uncharacterized protein n=1 Tax=Chengkuizengella marina TaxID=2507566 RepID=A0A6N9Q0Y6_9BACL|nr:hypothetical protein [Chengkuizengella marina]NBI28423.1 hypothetical protein [Chengkuizengella marina]